MMIAFVVYQTFKLNDTLIDTLLLATQAAVNAAEKAHKEAYYQERGHRIESFAELADQLGQNVQETLSAIKRIILDGQLSDKEKVTLIDAALDTKGEKPDPVERQISEFKQNLTAVHLGRDYHALLEEQSLKLQHRVADIVRQVRFAPNCSKPALWKALLHYQDKGGNIDKGAPDDFLSAAQRTALTGPDGKFRVSLYKVLLYVEIADAIKSGSLNLTHSEKYRSLDDYMIPKADWDARRAVNVHPPLHRQRQEGQSLASTGDGSLQVFPGGMAAPTAGVDDTGQQGELMRPLGCAGAMADLPQNHPMPQGAFGFVVGQRPKRIREDSKDRLPVVQEFDREFMRLGMGMSFHRLATASKRLQAFLPFGAQ